MGKHGVTIIILLAFALDDATDWVKIILHIVVPLSRLLSLFVQMLYHDWPKRV